MYRVRNNFGALCECDHLAVGPFVQNSSNLRDPTKVEESYVGDPLQLLYVTPPNLREKIASREGLSNTKSKLKMFFMHRGREGPALRPFFL
jgi:hypothetical protein